MSKRIKLTNIEALEYEGYGLSEDEALIVDLYFRKEIELYHDGSRVYTESGIYIADLMRIISELDT